jgi:hypothetical protein
MAPQKNGAQFQNAMPADGLFTARCVRANFSIFRFKSSYGERSQRKRDWQYDTTQPTARADFMSMMEAGNMAQQSHGIFCPFKTWTAQATHN